MYYHLILSLKRKNKHGLAPIYCRITINNKKYDRSTGIYVKPSDFNPDFKRVKPNTWNADETNLKLAAFEAKLHSKKYTSIQELDGVLENVPPEIKEQKIYTMVEVLNQYMEYQATQIDKPKGIKYGTYKTYNGRIENIKSFLNSICKPQLPIENFNSVKAEKFLKWAADKNFATSHANKHIRLIKTVLRFSQLTNNTLATNIGLVKLKADESKPIVYLTAVEIERLLKTEFNSKIYTHVRDLFIIQCYTGLTFSDLYVISQKNIEVHHGIKFLIYNRNKTNIEGIVPFKPIVEALFEKYNYQLPSYTNQAVNRCLKEIAAICNIDKYLTSHVGRKTFATATINAGVSIESTTKMLGKTSISDTAKTYAKILPMRLIKELPELRQTSLF